MVATRHGIGTFVLQSNKSDFAIKTASVIAIRDVLAMLELRIGIETEAAALAAIRHNGQRSAGDAQQRLNSFHDHLQQRGSDRSPDFQFHLGISRAAGNDYFWNILNQLGPSAIPRSRFPINERQPHEREYLVRISHEHEDIYDAVSAPRS